MNERRKHTIREQPRHILLIGSFGLNVVPNHKGVPCLLNYQTSFTPISEPESADLNTPDKEAAV